MERKDTQMNKRLFIKRKHPLGGKMFCGKIQVDPSKFPPIDTSQPTQLTSEFQPFRTPFTNYQIKTRNTADLDYSTQYTPAGFYRSFDKPLGNKIKKFLSNPPYNSDEYFDKLKRPRRAISESSESQVFEEPYQNLESDGLSESVKLMLPERRSIHSMVLPPIRESCTENFSDKYSGSNEPVFDEELDEFEKLRYCTYLRESKINKLGESSSHGTGFPLNDIRKHLHSR